MPRNGKGDAPRHNIKKYGKRWEEIFGKALTSLREDVKTHSARQAADTEKLATYLADHMTQRKHRRRRNDRVK